MKVIDWFERGPCSLVFWAYHGSPAFLYCMLDLGHCIYQVHVQYELGKWKQLSRS